MRTGGDQGGGIIATITEAPNFDFGFLPSKLAKWILDNHYYSIDWAHVRVANDSLVFLGSPPPQTVWHNGSCETWWDLPAGLAEEEGDSDDPLIWETIVVNATQPVFCTSTLASFLLAKLRRNALSEWLEARDISLEARTGTGGPGAVTKTKVSYLPQPAGQQPLNPGGKIEASPGPLPTVNFGDPTPVSASPAQSPGNPLPSPSAQQNQQPPSQPIDSIISVGIAQAIASAFPGSSPQNSPAPQNSPPVQNGSPSNSPGIGAIIASAFGNIPSGNGNNPPVSPQQGQVNGVPYSVAPGGIVVGGTTYSSSNPTVVPLPNGQTLVVGSNGVVQIGGVTIPTSTGPSDWSGSVNGINYQINPDGTVVINGQTLNLATPTSVTLPGGKVVTIGPNGINFGGTVVPFPSGLAAAIPTPMTVAGIAFSVGAGEVIISGKTYSFPPGATGTTVVIDGKTISIGPSGIGFPSTTIPLTNPTAMGVTTTKSSTGSTTSQTSSSNPSGTTATPVKTTKKAGAAGFKALLGPVVALELLAIFAISLLYAA